MPLASTPAMAIEKANRTIAKYCWTSPTNARPAAWSGCVGTSRSLSRFIRHRNCAHKNARHSQRRIRNCINGTQKSTNHQPAQVMVIPESVLTAYHVDTWTAMEVKFATERIYA